jgi:hypothetical protein
MRRVTFTLSALLLCSTAPLKAQDLSIGVRTGINLASADATGPAFSQDVGTYGSFHGGLVGAVDLARFFGIQTGIIYSRKGFSEGDGSVALKLTYVEIPVLAVLHIPARFSPHLYLGPVIGLESGCSVSTDEVDDANCEEAGPGAPATRGADSGLLFGAGIGFETGPGTMLVDVLYSLGLTNIGEPSDAVRGINTRTWQFSVAFLFPIGRERVQAP